MIVTLSWVGLGMPKVIKYTKADIALTKRKIELMKCKDCGVNMGPYNDNCSNEKCPSKKRRQCTDCGHSMFGQCDYHRGNSM